MNLKVIYKYRYIIPLIIVAVIAMIRYFEIYNTINDFTYQSIKNDNTKMKMYNYLKGKSITKLQEIVKLSAKKNKNRRVILLYNITDCSTCVRNGYTISQIVNNSMRMDNYFIIAEDCTPEQNKALFKSDLSIYYDKGNLLRQDLKYAYTPICIFVDENDIIQELFFINSTMSEKNLRKAAEFIINYMSEQKHDKI